MIHEQALLAVTGALTLGFGDSEENLKSPGQLQKHYSPKAKLVVLSRQNDDDLGLRISNFEFRISKPHVVAHTRIPSGHAFDRVSVIPHDPEAFARALYAELHQCDEAGADLIIVEAVPETDEWRAIADRLKRAAS
jgi:L-threonylcarbamoyladenylate synthase